MRLFKQILSLLLIAAVFIAFNASVYILVTSRCSTNFGRNSATVRSIDVESYLPFDDSSKIVRISSSLKITENMPVLDGATALLPVFSAFANAVYPSGSCEFDGEKFTEDSALQYTDTLRAYEAVVDGGADIIFCASPSEGQLEYARQKGVELVFTPIGKEAFVFLVNSQNPVDSLTAEQIRGIYTGKYTNWSEVGGADRIINPLTRKEGSGSQSALDSFLQGEEIKKSPLAIFGGTLGFSFRYYVDGIVGNDGVKMLCVDGVYPDTGNIQNGSYPLIANFYAVYRADNDNENVGILIDWILSDEGQQIINESGYVGIS